MNKKEFRQALLRGPGRCLRAARGNPERYREIVMWACRHEVAFDPQCEGSKAWFVYQLICCYEDRTPFLKTLLAELEKARSDGGWKMLYLAELASHFALDGDLTAEAALWRKYEALYASLMARKRAPRGRTFPERDDFAMLCQVLAARKETMAKIAEDIGRLYRENPIYDGGDFDWLFSTSMRWMGTLKKLALKSENIAAYLWAGEEEEARWEQIRRSRPERKSGRALSRWLRREGDEDTIRAYAEAYRREQDPQVRAEALGAFIHCPYPDDPAPVIADTGSGCAQLRRAAWGALECVRHPAVREFAMKQMKTAPENALPVLLANYEAADEPWVTKLVCSVPVDRACTRDWHGIQRDILNMEDRGVKSPAPLLRYIYDTTYCSCCREYALRQMGKRRLLTRQILEECLLDSNDDIRTYAARCLRRRKG